MKGSSTAAGRTSRLALALSWAVIAAWGVLGFFGATKGPKLLDHCHWSLGSPPGSPSDIAANMAGQLLPQKATEYTLSQAALVTGRSPASHPVTSPAIEGLTQRMLDATIGDCDAGVMTNISGTSRKAYGVPTCWWRDMHGIFAPDGNAYGPKYQLGPERLFEDRDLDVWKDLMSPDNRSATLVLWDINVGFGADGNKWQEEAWSRLRSAIDSWLAEPLSGSAGSNNGDLYEVGFTHTQMLLTAGEKGIIADFEHGDMITVSTQAIGRCL